MGERLWKCSENSLKFIALLCFFPLLYACGGAINKPFVKMDSSFVIKPSTIAVIAGFNEEPDKKLAEVLTEELKTRTSFNVLTQEEITKNFPKYPMRIELSQSTKLERPEWFSSEGKRKIDLLQSKIKARYIYVLWVNNLSAQTTCAVRGGCSTTYYMTVIGNLIEYPVGKTVAYTHIEEDASPSILNLTVFRSSAYFVEKMIKRISEKIVNGLTEEIRAR